MLKAAFNECFAIPNRVTSSDDGLSLVPYTAAWTVAGELNKLASNIAFGREAAVDPPRTA